MSADDYIVEKNSSQLLEEKALTLDPLKQEESLTTNDAVNACDAAIVGTADPSLVSDVRNIDKESGIVDHLQEWLAENLDLNVNKQELHIDDKKLENIYPTAANHIKFQLHQVFFKTEVPFEDVADTLHNIESIINIAGSNCEPIVNCEKIVKHDPQQLNIDDEFRFTVPLLEHQRIIKFLLRIYVPVVANYWIQRLLTRTFDIRVIGVTFTTPSVDLTVQTLSNHPYAARRSWRLKMTANPNEYIFETVEVNSFPWIIDYFVEKAFGGRQPLCLWENFLREIVKQNEGTILDDALIDGKKTTFYGNLNQILDNNIVVQRVLSEYPLIAEEVNRLRL